MDYVLTTLFLGWVERPSLWNLFSILFAATPLSHTSSSYLWLVSDRPLDALKINKTQQQRNRLPDVKPPITVNTHELSKCKKKKSDFPLQKTMCSWWRTRHLEDSWKLNENTTRPQIFRQSPQSSSSCLTLHTVRCWNDIIWKKYHQNLKEILTKRRTNTARFLIAIWTVRLKINIIFSSLWYPLSFFT